MEKEREVSNAVRRRLPARTRAALCRLGAIRGEQADHITAQLEPCRKQLQVREQVYMVPNDRTRKSPVSSKTPGREADEPLDTVRLSGCDGWDGPLPAINVNDSVAKSKFDN